MKIKPILLTLALLLTATAAKANNGVSWGNSPFDPLPLYDNFGNLLDDTFTFELGTFGNSFVPTAFNTSQWAANWKLLSRAEAPAVSGWNSVDQVFGQTFTFDTNGTVQGLSGSATFSAGEQAYLWVYCNGEWALVTDDTAGTGPDDIWQLPDPASLPGSALTWVLDNATTPIIGGVNGVQSGTPYNFDPGASFRLQTAVVPEPGTSLLIVLAGLVARLRRRQRWA